MRCAKCSYISFDYLDRCKNCGEDLVPAKIKLNIYSKTPEIEIGAEGFVVSKVTADRADKFIETGAPDKKAKDVSMEEVLNMGGDKLENFDFGEDKS